MTLAQSNNNISAEKSLNLKQVRPSIGQKSNINSEFIMSDVSDKKKSSMKDTNFII